MQDGCIFCKIAAGEIPSATIYEDEDLRVILDLGPASFGHALVIPKEHYKDITELPDELGGKILSVAKRYGMAFMKELEADGFNIVQNNGEAAGQTVMHFHMHIIPRYYDGPEVPLWTSGKLDEKDAEKILKFIKL